MQTDRPGLLHNRAFLLLFSGMAISQLGDSLYELVLPIWVMQATGSARAMALLAGTSTVIRLAVAPLAGTLADRSDRRRVMLGADMSRGLVVLLLAAGFKANLQRLPFLLGGAGLLALAGAFFSPAYAAAQTGLVHPQDLTRSLSLWQIMRQTVSFVGPPVAGLTIGFLGHAGSLALDGLTFFASMACLALIRLRWAPAPARVRHSFWQDFKGGLTAIFRSRIITRTVLLGAGVNLAGAAFGVLLPVIALREMRLGPSQYGLFQMVSPAGVMAGMLLLTAVAGGIRRRGRFMLVALLGMGIANCAMGLASRPPLFMGLLFLGGLTFGLSNVMFADIWRRLVPAEQQGRFFGMQASLNQMLMPVGLAIAGMGADRFSPYAVAAGAGGLVVALALWGFAGPGLRDLA